MTLPGSVPTKPDDACGSVCKMHHPFSPRVPRASPAFFQELRQVAAAGEGGNRRGHLGRGGKPLRRLLGQHAVEHRAKALGHVGPQLADGGTGCWTWASIFFIVLPYFGPLNGAWPVKSL